MTKDEFKLLSIEDQVKEINSLVEVEGSLTKACDRLTVSRSSIRIRFKSNGYEFCKTCNKYIEVNEHSCNTDEINNNKSIKKKRLEHNENTSVLLNESMKKKFMWMMNNFDILETLISERIQSEYICNTDIIEVKSSEFIIDLPEAPLKHTTIRLNEVVWRDFNRIYKDNYKHLNKYDVLSMALKHFTDKHK